MPRKKNGFKYVNPVEAIQQRVDDICRQVHCKLSGLCCDMQECMECVSPKAETTEEINKALLSKGQLPLRVNGRV